MNGIPVLGWLLSLAIHMSFAFPLWVAWTKNEIGEKFFYFLPEVYYNVGYWEIVGILTCVTILNRALTPRFYQTDYSKVFSDAKSKK